MDSFRQEGGDSFQNGVFQPVEIASPVSPVVEDRGQHRHRYVGVRNKPKGPTKSKACNLLITCTQGLPVFIALGFILFGLVGFNLYVGADIVQSPWLKAIYYPACNILCGMLLWSYAKVILTKPGSVPDEFAVAKEFHLCDDAGQLNGIRPFVHVPRPMYEKCNTGAPRYCYKCNVLKPDRAHHCSICKECVLKMDHHCPWVANCVGFHNQKFFVLFLAYTFVYCMFFLVILMPYLVVVAKSIAEACKEQIKEGPCSPFSEKEVPGVPYPTLVVVMFILAGIFALAVGGLGAIHIYYVLENTNSIESMRIPKVWAACRSSNPYDLGRRRNWAYVMGPVWWLWFLPVANGEGDGVVYPLCVVEDEEAQVVDSDAVALLGSHNSS